MQIPFFLLVCKKLKQVMNMIKISNISPNRIQKLGAFVIGAVVKQLYPSIRLISAHASDDDFYYEFGVQHPLKNADLIKIHKALDEFISSSPKIQQFSIRIEDAYWLFRSEPEKLVELDKLINEYFAPPVICQINEYFDICCEEIPEILLDSIVIEEIKGIIPSQQFDNSPWIRQRIYGSVRA
ncbi:MAG: hypothetical protein DRO88_02455 [Promethearchaeia archaeon]|nr:MAG: hypothetical protein DRO88_02455 [Candidatus Lokiarchaeia archaeon]